MISQNDVQQLLEYDPDTGRFVWRYRDREWFLSDHGFKVWNAKHAGREAFTSSLNGYKQGRLLKMH